MDTLPVEIAISILDELHWEVITLVCKYWYSIAWRYLTKTGGIVEYAVRNKRSKLFRWAVGQHNLTNADCKIIITKGTRRMVDHTMSQSLPDNNIRYIFAWAVVSKRTKMLGILERILSPTFDVGVIAARNQDLELLKRTNITRGTILEAVGCGNPLILEWLLRNGHIDNLSSVYTAAAEANNLLNLDYILFKEGITLRMRFCICHIAVKEENFDMLKRFWSPEIHNHHILAERALRQNRYDMLAWLCFHGCFWDGTYLDSCGVRRRLTDNTDRYIQQFIKIDFHTYI